MSRLIFDPRKFNSRRGETPGIILFRNCLKAFPVMGLFAGNMLLADGPVVPDRQPASQALPTPQEFELTELLWSVPIRSFSSRSDASDLSDVVVPSSPSVVVSENVVLLQDDEGVRGLDLRNGRAAWPTSDSDSGDLMRTFTVSSPLTSPPAAIPAGAIAGHRWIGVLNQQLMALDLSAEGRLDWTLRIDELLDDIRARGRIVSSPLIRGDQFFISVRNEKEHMHSLICCTLSGVVVWRTEPKPLPPTDQMIPLDQLGGPAESGEELVWFAGGERLSLIDCTTGMERWGQNVSASHLSEMLLMEAASAAVSLLVKGDRIHVLAGGALSIFDRANGTFLHRDQTLLAKWHLLGADAGTLVASGRGVMGIDTRTGAVRWELGGEIPELQTSGDGLLRDGMAFWPARSELWQIDVQQGRIVQRISLESLTGRKTGSLSLHNDVLLLLTSDRCSAFRVRRRQTP